MLALDLNVQYVLPVTNSWLHREMHEMRVSWSPVSTRDEVVKQIEGLSFDVFVSTGLPFILPLTRLRRCHPQAEFVNIHPSLLPDLRGADPIPGAILHRRDSGVTAHIMDDGIDTGEVIAQSKIGFDPCADAKLLYHLCFSLERKVFRAALQRDFVPLPRQPAVNDSIYYTFKNGDLVCSEKDSDSDLMARIRAFNTPHKGAVVSVDGVSLRVFGIRFIAESSIVSNYANASHNEVIGTYEDCMLIKRVATVCLLSGISHQHLSQFMGKRMFS